MDNVNTGALGYIKDDIVAASDSERGKNCFYFFNTSNFEIIGKVNNPMKMYFHFLMLNETILLAAGL